MSKAGRKDDSGRQDSDDGMAHVRYGLCCGVAVLLSMLSRTVEGDSSEETLLYRANSFE